MYLQLADWMIPLIFLSALVLLLKFRPALTSVSRESYNCVASGVVILTIIAVARVYYLNGLFAYIPFLSEPLFYRVVSWIGIITGTLLVVNGMSLWLPLVRKWQQNERNDSRYSDFLRKIERLTQVETRAERLTSLALTAMSEHFRISRGLVLRYSRRDNRFDLTGSIPATFCVADSFKSTSLNSQHWRQVIANSSAPVASAVEGLPEQLQNPDVTLPLTLGDQPLGCYLLWLEPGRSLGEEDMNCLRLAIEIIARKVDADRYRLRADYFHQLTLLHERILETASSEKPLLKNLGAVLAAVSQTLNLDYVSLQIIGAGSRPVTCLTMGANGALLIEKGLASPPDHSPIQQAFLTGRPVFQQEPNRSSAAFPDDRRLGMPSFAAVPLPTGTRHNFIFVLSSQTYGGIGWQTARMLQSLGPIVTRMAELAESSASRTGADRVLVELCHLYRTARLERDYGALCRSLASFLKRTLPADGVRISAVEPDSPFLQSLALLRPSGVPAETTHDSLMIRSLMPNHDKAIQTGRLALLPSEFSTGPLTVTEAGQCLGDKINSMIIAPVPNETGTSTIITVGRSADQGHRPFGRSEVLTVRAAADCLAAFGVEAPVVPTTEFRPFQVNAHSPYPAPELRSRMKSSLSGIIGSVELIKAQGEPGAPSVNRYLSIIDKSAQQMHRYLKQAEPLATSPER